MTTHPIRSKVLDFLGTRTVKNGESVEYGWFIFRTVVEDGCLDLETLDFRAMASFTRDFSAVEQIEAEQAAMLEKQQVKAEHCALWHAALISRSYAPNNPDVFLQRLDPLDGNDSGWYIGVVNDPLDVNDPANLYRKSLYELTIHDPRLSPYWLLPFGFLVEFKGHKLTINSGAN